jgi:hypothetical protein
LPIYQVMDRLREFSIVTVSLPDSARVSEFKAYVVGVHHSAATLQPVEHVQLPGAVADVLMTFAHGAQTVGLKGELKADDRPGDVHFRVTDGVCVPRRRSSRLKLCAPAAIGELTCQTYDIGVDGVTLEGVPELRLQQRVSLSLMLPEDADPVQAEAVVTELHGGALCSLVFTAMDPGTRRRLSDFVSEHFHRRLDIVRSLRASDS